MCGVHHIRMCVGSDHWESDEFKAEEVVYIITKVGDALKVNLFFLCVFLQEGRLIRKSMEAEELEFFAASRNHKMLFCREHDHRDARTAERSDPKSVAAVATDGFIAICAREDGLIV